MVNVARGARLTADALQQGDGGELIVWSDQATRFWGAADARGGGWTRRRLEGKALSMARLAKASLTYAGGIDYLAWKINRHAGTAIEIKPWQRRWPSGWSLIWPMRQAWWMRRCHPSSSRTPIWPR